MVVIIISSSSVIRSSSSSSSSMVRVSESMVPADGKTEEEPAQ